MQTVLRGPKRKAEIVRETMELIGKYRVIGVADLHKIRGGLLQDLRRLLRGRVVIRCVKNTMLKRAMEELGLPGAVEFFNEIPGSNISIFSDMNPFKLSLLLQRNKVRVIAKPGDIAPEDITVPAGNTGLAPGPIISMFGRVGLRTRIESGTVWVVEDTVLARAGEKISEDVARVLARIGIKAADIGLSLKSAYEEGRILTLEELIVDLEAVREQLKKASAESLQVAVRVAYPTPETVLYLLYMAREDVLKVAVECAHVTKETAPLILVKAHAMAAALEQRIRVLKSE